MSDFSNVVAGLGPEQRILFLTRLNDLYAKKRAASTIPRLQRSRAYSSFPLSFGQERLWLLDKLEPGSPAYTMAGAVRLTGQLDVGALESSLNAVVRRHEALRTTFQVANGEPRQVISPQLEVVLPMRSLLELSPTTRESEAQRMIDSHCRRPFDLSTGPLFRTLLLQTDEAEYIWLLAMHHIISDHWSMGIFIREIADAYTGKLEGAPGSQAELPIQYVDFAHWQRQWLSGDTLATQLRYWKQQLAGAPADLELSITKPRPQVRSFNGSFEPVSLPPGLTASLKALGRDEGATLFMVVLTAFNLLMHRYSGRTDLVVGSGISTRRWSDLEGLIGFFVNTVALRSRLSGNPTFRELLTRVKQASIGAFAHQDVPYDRVIEELGLARNRARSPLIQVAFTLQTSPVPAFKLPGLTVTPIEIDTGTAKFDLELSLLDRAEGLSGRMEYSTDLFEANDVCRMLQDLESLLQRAVSDPNWRIDSSQRLERRLERSAKVSERGRRRTDRDQLRTIRRRQVSLADSALVETGYLSSGESLPLVIQPRMRGVNLVSWAAANSDFLESRLLKLGGILFRGFDVSSPSEFERFATAVSKDLEEYRERSTPRVEIEGRIYSSTEYPADQTIALHNEQSYTRWWPMRIWFYCSTPPSSGGETPIADSRKVFELINPEIKKLFMRHGVTYLRNYGSALDLSWQEVFQTSSKAEVEAYCRNAGIEFEWRPGDRLRTRHTCQATAKHPATGEEVWFNQAHLFHVSNLPAEVRRSLLASTEEEELPRNACFGDGSGIDSTILDEIREAYSRVSVSFTWQKFDVLMLDNMLTAHGRNPYTGPRRILAAMADLHGSNGD